MEAFYKLQRLVLGLFIYPSLYVVTGRTPHSGNPAPLWRYEEAGAAEQRLLKYLLRNYDTDARGVTNVNSTVRVEIQLLLLRIQGLDERSQVLTTTGLVICDWQDDRLRWKKDEFDYLEDIVMRPQRIWLPELALMNGADELAPDFKKIRVLVRHDGHVHWEPGGIFTTTCDIDIRFFPFDEQNCIIQFGAWAYYSSRMNITNASHEIQTHDFKKNGEWEVLSTESAWKETQLPCCMETRYPYVEFTLYLRRRYTFYVMNIILPCTLLSMLVMVVFCLPPDAGEKVSLGISVLLAFTVFLLMVAESIPRTSLHIPVIVVYLTFTMGLGTASVCMTVLVLNLHHRDAERPVPRWARILVLTHLSRILCVKPRKPKTMAHNQLCVSSADGVPTLRSGLRKIARDVGLLRPMLSTANGDIDNNRYSNGPMCQQHMFNSCAESNANSGPPKPDHSHEWKEIAHVLDRLFFWVVFIFMSASVLIIMLVPFYKNAIKDVT